MGYWGPTGIQKITWYLWDIWKRKWIRTMNRTAGHPWITRRAGQWMVKNLVIICFPPQSQEIWEHVHIMSPSGVNTNTSSKPRIKSPVTWPISAFTFIVLWNTCAALISSASSLSYDFSEPACERLSLEKVTGDEESDFGQFVVHVFVWRILGRRKMSEKGWKIPWKLLFFLLSWSSRRSTVGIPRQFCQIPWS